MNNKFKRALSSILAFVMVVSTLTVMNVSSVFAASETISADGNSYSDGATVKEGTYLKVEAVGSVGKTSEAVNGYENGGTDSSKINAWTGSSTNYTIYDKDGTTSLTGSYRPIFKITPTSDGYLSVTYRSQNNKSSYLATSSGTETSTDEDGTETSATVYYTDSSKYVSTCTISDTTTYSYSYYTATFEVTANSTYYFGQEGTTPRVYSLGYSGGEVSATGISVSPTAANVAAGGSTTLTATVTPSDSTDTVTWTSSDTDVATVTGGVVTGVSEGAATITAAAGNYSATATINVYTGTSVNSTITWDFSEYGDSTDEGATDDGTYNGLTYVLNSNNSSDYIYSGGIHTNGSSNSSRRYITYTPEYDGTLTVYFKSNNYSSARTCYIGTSVNTSSYLASTTTEVYESSEAAETATVSAALTAGTKYYVYFDNGCTASLLTYAYTTTEIIKYAYFGVSDDDAKAYSSYSIVTPDGTVLDTDSTVYEGVEVDGVKYTASELGLSTEYVIGYKVILSATGNVDDLDITFNE